MLNWLRSLAAQLSGPTARPDRLDMPAIDADFRDGGESFEPGVPARDDNQLEELERLLRETSRGP